MRALGCVSIKRRRNELNKGRGLLPLSKPLTGNESLGRTHQVMHNFQWRHEDDKTFMIISALSHTGVHEKGTKIGRLIVWIVGNRLTLRRHQQTSEACVSRQGIISSTLNSLPHKQILVYHNFW